MSYQVLARKWRPKTFREMVGQEHVLKALINALDRDRLHHAYLFTGTRGVGKTTIARILAKCLNCDMGVSSEPCGQCSACTSIANGSFIDLIEVDAASRTKVEDTRELLENVQYAPTVGRYKVYLIDEVHMLSTHSFNALLKTLEEPPPHVKFLLATTDPQKLPATILSRCLQFNLKNMTPERIVGHLHDVLDKEMVAHEEQALWLLGRAADGSMRDALSLTDQGIAFGSGKIEEADIRTMLGTIDQSAIYDIIDGLAERNAASMLDAVRALSEHAPDFLLALEEMLTVLHRIAMTQALPGVGDNSYGDKERIAALAKCLASEDVQLFYQIALIGRRDLPLCPDPRGGFEMVLLRMLAFKPAGIPEIPTRGLKSTSTTPSEMGVSDLVKKPEAVAQFSSSDKPQSVNCNDGTQSNTAIEAKQNIISQDLALNQATLAPKETAEALPHSKLGVVAKEVVAQEIVTKEIVAKQVVFEPPKITQQSSTADSDVVDSEDDSKVTIDHLSPETWSRLFDRLGFGGVVGNIASHCVLDKVDGEHFHFLLDKKNATLFNDTYTSRIEEHLTVTFNALVKIHIIVGDVTSETPAARKERMAEELRCQALSNIQTDENIQILIADFGAVLDQTSVVPL